MQVLAYVELNRLSSNRHLNKEIGISYKKKVHTIKKKNKLHLYKPNLAQKLVPGDSHRRLTFNAWFMVQLREEPDFYDLSVGLTNQNLSTMV